MDVIPENCWYGNVNLGSPYGSVAQLVEHVAVNHGVAGSKPAGIAKAQASAGVGHVVVTVFCSKFRH